ncbi:RICIN domain-containing protein [Chitinivorax sp. B]|uniref:GH12 family glycosyl hydrolase domain-containing protein n=1 Tax=Chitinivorax sp. B TaxID=2502235 RepID=UPI0010F7ADFE|nr:RICIN domain-containing protein [Chitinivorax sp. B]
MKRAKYLELSIAVMLAYGGSAFADYSCERYPEFEVKGGEYKVIGNYWNDAAQGTAQCIEVNKATGEWKLTQSGWVRTDGPPSGYPAIFKGCHWGSCTKNSGLPLKLSDVKNAPSRWRVTSAPGGHWNNAYDIWFAQSPDIKGQPDGTEIMIWINKGGNVGPAGQKTGNVNINGMNWDVYTAPKGSAGFNDKWHIVSYVATNPSTNVNFDLKPFFDDSVQRGLLQYHWYLIDVEAGTEPWQNGAGFQSHEFEVKFNSGPGPIPGPIDPNRWYNVINQNSGACVDDAEYGTWNGAKVQQWSCNTNGAANQRWKFTPTDNGFYKITTQQAAHLAMDVANWGTSNGSPVQLWNYGGGNNQQWKPVELGNGHYKLIGRDSGKCLDVPAASKANGVQLQLYDCNGTAAQAFKLLER